MPDYCEIGARVRRPEEENASCALEDLPEVPLRAGFGGEQCIFADETTEAVADK